MAGSGPAMTGAARHTPPGLPSPSSPDLPHQGPRAGFANPAAGVVKSAVAYWGKIIGGMAGFAMGGPVGAMFGAALGHAADSGVMPELRRILPGADPAAAIRMAARFGGREQVLSLGVITLAAKLAKIDGPVRREEIAAFRARFRVPPEALHQVGALFDQARHSADGYQDTAAALGHAFADQPGTLEDLLASLFAIAAADGAVNRAEHGFLSDVHAAFHLDQAAWDRARGAAPPRRAEGEADPYAVLGVTEAASAEELRGAWKALMRTHHPDSLAAQGIAPDIIARGAEKVARINAAWDRIKRERGL